MTTPVMYAAQIDPAQLQESVLVPPAAEPLSGEILVRQHVLYREGGVVSGTWESEPGRSRWTFTDHGEVIHVLSGRMTVTEDGHDPIALEPGATAVFGRGWAGEWDVAERLRKVFVVF